MPIKTVCPECDKTYTLADTMAGKSVKCKGCGQAFTVEAADGVTAVAAKPSNGKGKAAGARKGDDEDEAPKKGGLGKVLLIGGALVAVLMLFVCGGLGVGGFFLYRYMNSDDSPTVSNTTTDKDNSNADKSNADKSNADKTNVDKSNADKTKTDKDKGPPPQPKRISKATFDQLKIGMAQAQVEGILGPPTGGVGGKDGAYNWIDSQNVIALTYRDGKVTGGTALIDGQNYQMADAGSPMPKKNGVSQETFNKIKGGEPDNELIGALFRAKPTQDNATIDADMRQYITDKGRVMVWRDGNDSITVGLNPSGKTACWKAVLSGLPVGPFSNPDFVVKSADAGAKVTKDNFNKIKGGMKEFDVAQVLGQPTNGNAPAVAAAANFDKVHTQVWQNGADSITVTYCDHKAAEWEGTIGGEKLGPTIDTNSVILKNATQVTKANYDKINKGAAELAVVQLLGAPTSKSGVANHKAGGGLPAHTSYHYKWSDGQGGEITVHFLNFGAGGVVDRKEEFRIK
jgi:outer membrane protein assembly factor BamE (lipoprotein component of BamABCDE complex)